MSAVLEEGLVSSARELDSLQPHLEARIRNWIERQPPKKLYHTRGVYASGEFKDNIVYAEDLAIHMEYNLVYRPGRAFIVEGIVVCNGFLKQEQLQAAISELRSQPEVRYKPSVTYN